MILAPMFPELSLILNNASKRQAIAFSMRIPELESFLDARSEQVSRWRCSYSIKSGNSIQERTAYSETWAGALVMAMEGMRLAIPDEEQNDWTTSDGLPSWLVFPKTIPVGWGYEEHTRLWQLVRSEQAEINRRVESKRSHD